MAAQPAPPARKRRPPEVRLHPEPLGPRALRIGLRTTLLAPLGAAASLALFGDGGPGLGSLLPVFLVLVAAGAAVAFLPWDRLSGTTTGTRILHVWAALDIVLIAIAGRATDASDPALPLAYAVTIVFFAVALSPAAQAAFVGFLLVCYGVLTASTFALVPFSMLAAVGVLACFLSRELRRRIAAYERARIAAERRWAVVGSVSSAARDRSDAEPRRVLQGVVDAIVALGYETAAIHLPGEPPDRQVVLPAADEADPTRGIRTLPEKIRTQVLEEGRDAALQRKTVDRQAVRGLRSSGVETLFATPIVVGARPEGVLLVGSTDPDGIAESEVQAFAMLAATAALALGNARRADEQRLMAKHLADADAVRAEVLTTLSKEVRKPLGAVTETSRALRETFGNEDRRRLIERLVTSATALDVTLGGSIDLSLLEASHVELQRAETDVGGLVMEVLTRLSGLFDGRQLRADVPTDLIVEVDPGLLDQAIEHLLVTAAASTPPGKAVDVAVSRTGAETTVKVVTDTVIPAEQLARIHEPHGNGNGGAGPWIRLAIASKILDLHGTALETRSDPKRGTRAWFVLPGERSAKPALAEETGPVQLTLDDALLPALAAAAARIEPPPVEIEEEERGSTPLAAAALAATAATSLAVTGFLPQLLPQRDVPAATIEHKDPQPKKKPVKKKERRQDPQPKSQGGQASNGSSASAGGATSGGSTGGTTGGTTGGGGTGGTGGGSGGDGVSPSPSPQPPPPGHDGSPGNSGEAPGHNKHSPTPSPSPSP